MGTHKAFRWDAIRPLSTLNFGEECVNWEKSLSVKNLAYDRQTVPPDHAKVQLWLEDGLTNFYQILTPKLIFKLHLNSPKFKFPLKNHI